MTILGISLTSLFLAQFIKIFTVHPPNLTRFAGSGGMPSSHASFVSSLSTMIGLKHGFSSDLFAIVTVFSLIVIYDAGGVRRAVGKQANVLNHLIRHLNLTKLDRDKEILKEDLKELIGHTSFEVLAGTIMGISLALFNWYVLLNP